MNDLGALLLDLVGSMPDDAGSPEDGVVVAVDALDVALPVEARIGAAGELMARLPLGRLHTGFETPLARLRARFERAP